MLNMSILRQAGNEAKTASTLDAKSAADWWARFQAQQVRSSPLFNPTNVM